MTNFLRLVQFESICSRQNKFNLEKEILFGIGRKHYGQKEKMLVTRFSPFPTMFSEGFFISLSHNVF